MPFIVSPEITEAIQQHALEDFPNEACGFITADGYVRVDNISDDPENHFEIAATDFITYKDARAFIHSHPVADAFEATRYKPGFYPFCPSADDMVSQITTGMVFGIVVTNGTAAAEPFYWGDFILDEPLYDRPFRHGVEDCYTICRKWFWQEKGIKLADVPRDPDWWKQGDDLFMLKSPGLGFVRLGSTEQFLPGDIGLTHLGPSTVVNHAFLNLGDGTICHHLPGRLSTREAAGGRQGEQMLWLRYAGPSKASGE